MHTFVPGDVSPELDVLEHSPPDLIPNCDNCSEGYLQKIKLIYAKFPIEEWKTFGFYDDAIIKTVNVHWLMFNAPAPAVHNTFAVVYGIIMFAGIMGNLLALIVFCRCRSIRTPANYLILNLTISDFILLAKIPIFIINSIYKGPVVGPIGCQLYGFIGGLTGTASIMTLTMIAIDRYHVIVHPLNPFKKTTHRRALLMICFVWIYSMTFAMVPLFHLGGYVPEGLLTSCSFDYLEPSTENRIFIFVYFVAAWLLPLSLIVFSYTAIFHMVLQAEKFSEFQHDSNSRITRKKSPRNRENRLLRKEWKITIVTTIIVLCWVLAWTPYAVVALLGIFGQKHLITPLISAIPAVFCKTAACIDPFIYALSHPKFKRELLKFPLLSTCISRFGRRRTLQDTSSHYCSATCLAKSDDLDNQITLHSFPEANFSSLGSPGGMHVVLVCRDSRKISSSLQEMRLCRNEVNSELSSPSMFDESSHGRNFKGKNASSTSIIKTTIRRRSLPLICGSSYHHEDCSEHLQQHSVHSKLSLHRNSSISRQSKSVE